MHNILFLWYDYDKNMNGEHWFKIKPLDKIVLYKYLSNQIGISELINHSSIVLCYRSYDNYQKIIVKEEIKNKYDYKMPDNVTLGYNFISLLGEKTEIKRKYDQNVTEQEIIRVIDTKSRLQKVNFSVRGQANERCDSCNYLKLLAVRLSPRAVICEFRLFAGDSYRQNL